MVGLKNEGQREECGLEDRLLLRNRKPAGIGFPSVDNAWGDGFWPLPFSQNKEIVFPYPHDSLIPIVNKAILLDAAGKGG